MDIDFCLTYFILKSLHTAIWHVDVPDISANLPVRGVSLTFTLPSTLHPNDPGERKSANGTSNE